jgi:hypothetical protein
MLDFFGLLVIVLTVGDAGLFVHILVSLFVVNHSHFLC